MKIKIKNCNIIKRLMSNPMTIHGNEKKHVHVMEKNSNSHL